MRFKLVIDKTQEETVVATVHERSRLTDEMELLVLQHDGSDRIAAYTEDGMRMLPFSDIECITVLDGKTYAVTRSGERCRLKLRLYELEAMLPASFIRINKSALANEAHLERFTACFAVGYALIWGIILLSIRHRTNRINRHLRGGK